MFLRQVTEPAETQHSSQGRGRHEQEGSAKRRTRSTSVPSRPRVGPLGDISKSLETRMGKVPVRGRYHHEPRRLEDDYVMNTTVLGSGHNGDVRLAFSRSQPGQRFAVKSLQLGGIFKNLFCKDRPEIEQFKAEVEIYLSMDHPHIIRLYDVYETRRELHMVMECAEGGELFDRVIEQKQFSEADASNAMRHMLLALNYIHSHGIVHRDLKLENFLYLRKDTNYLKLIDFGFSNKWDPSSTDRLKQCVGTAEYVAPEVMSQSYTSQCDMWSLGVIGFILLDGYMPFSGRLLSGSESSLRIGNISAPCLELNNEVQVPTYALGENNSAEAHDFIKSLLEVDPSKRLTAQQALSHPWISGSCEERQQEAAMRTCCQALLYFSHASKFRRCCLEMMAWSLSYEDRVKVRDCFLSLNRSQQGTIPLAELKHVMVDKLNLTDEKEVEQVFQALGNDHSQEIYYSSFLAAMLESEIDVREEVLTDTFRRFDTDRVGYITTARLREVLGSKVEGETVDEAFISEADVTKDGRLSYPEFAAFCRGQPLSLTRVTTPPMSLSSLADTSAPLSSKPSWSWPAVTGTPRVWSCIPANALRSLKQRIQRLLVLFIRRVVGAGFSRRALARLESAHQWLIKEWRLMFSLHNLPEREPSFTGYE